MFIAKQLSSKTSFTFVENTNLLNACFIVHARIEMILTQVVAVTEYVLPLRQTDPGENSLLLRGYT